MVQEVLGDLRQLGTLLFVAITVALVLLAFLVHRLNHFCFLFAREVSFENDELIKKLVVFIEHIDCAVALFQLSQKLNVFFRKFVMLLEHPNPTRLLVDGVPNLVLLNQLVNLALQVRIGI